MNHLYCVAATAPEGNRDMLSAMWTSVANHIQDVHDGHDDLYPECEHGPLDEDETDKERLQPCKKQMQHSACSICYCLLIVSDL